MNEVISFFISLVGGATAYFISKAIDNKFKRDEEIREIKRKRYEELIETIEEILGRDQSLPTKIFLDKLNVIYAKMFISVPDDIVKIIKEDINKEFTPEKRRRIYLAIRKDLFGKKTKIRTTDLIYFSEGK